MSATILPTFTCFDDSLDYLAAKMRADGLWAFDHLRLVHAICLAPAGLNAGEPFAHAWVEQDRALVIEAGIFDDGQQAYYAVRRAGHYLKLRVQVATVYTCEQAIKWNRATGHYGPWESSYAELCSSKPEMFVDSNPLASSFIRAL